MFAKFSTAQNRLNNIRMLCRTNYNLFGNGYKNNLKGILSSFLWYLGSPIYGRLLNFLLDLCDLCINLSRITCQVENDLIHGSQIQHELSNQKYKQTSWIIDWHVISLIWRNFSAAPAACHAAALENIGNCCEFYITREKKLEY